MNLWAAIRPVERRLVFGALFTLFGIMTAHSLLETARDSLFLATLPPERLPWVYLAIAVFALAFTQLQSRLPLGSGNRTVLGSVIGLSTLITLGLWVVVDPHRPWSIFALYVWAGVYATLVVTRFWMVVEDVFTVTQAKRVFAAIGAGSVAGAIGGSALARAMVEFVEPKQLLLAAIVAMALTGLAPLFFLRREEARGHGHTLMPAGCQGPLNWGFCWRMIGERPYLKRLTQLVLLSALVLTLVDYLFKSIVAAQIEPESLPDFFATTYLGLNLLSLLLQLTLVSVMLRNLGLHRVLSTLPALLILGATSIVAVALLSPALLLIPALTLKGFDGALRYSLHRTSLETLFVPLSRELREQVKTTVDVMGQRGGQALGSAVILALVLLPRTEVLVAVAVVGLSGLWIRWAGEIRGHYLDLFRDTLSGGHARTRMDFPDLDLASLETLIERLNSGNDREVLAAMDVLADQGRVKLVPALLLYHPSAAVVTRALEFFARYQRHDALSVIERLSDHEDPYIRAAALRARSTLAPDVNRQLKEFLDDPSAMVRATALVTLVSANWIEGETAERALRSIANDAEHDEKIALLQSIVQQPDPAHATLLLGLAESEDLDVRLLVAQAMAEVADPRFLPALLEMLAIRVLRSDARRAFVAIGEEGLHFLDRALEDPEVAPAVRRHVPRTMHRYAPDLAAPVLMKHMMHDADGLVRFKCLRALGSLRERAPEIPLDEKVLREGLQRSMSGTLRLVDWAQQLARGGREDEARRTAVYELLEHTLENKRAHALERIFRLIGLLHPREDWESIYRGVARGDAQDRASGMELIEANLDPPLRESLLALVDDVDDAERLRRGQPLYAAQRRSYPDLLAEFLELGNLGLRCITMYHIGELGLVRFRERMQGFTDHPSRFQREVAERALELLDHPRTEAVSREP